MAPEGMLSRFFLYEYPAKLKKYANSILPFLLPISFSVALGLKYNEKADVYSLTLLVWEILELIQPYASFRSTERFLKSAWDPKGPKLRPPISKHVDKEVKVLLEKAWDSDFKARPSASEFEDTMRKLCVAFNEEIGANPGARRSTFIFVKGQGEVNNLSTRR